MGSFTLGCTDTPFLATCRCPTCVGHEYQHDSLDSGVQAVFFFFFASPTQRRHANNGKKKKNQDFDKWTNPYHWFCDIPFWVRSEKWEKIKNPHNPTVDFPLLATLCTLSLVGTTLGRLASSLYPFQSLTHSAWTSLSFSLFRDFFSFFLFFFFLLFADCFGPLVWCTVACYIYNTQSFFFFLIPLTVLYFTMYIYLLWI